MPGVVQAAEGRPLLHMVHPGNAAGTKALQGMLLAGLQRVRAACGGLALPAALAGARHALRPEGRSAAFLAWPRGPVLVFAGMVCVTFLVEGAMLDWGGLLLLERDLASMQTAGLGFAAFSVGMVAMRLLGDRVVERHGSGPVLMLSGCLAVLGIFGTLLLPWTAPVLACFCLVGIGAASIAPILFSACGRQEAMAIGPAVSIVAFAGYGGHLAGPAVVGFIAGASSVAFALAVLAILFLAIPAAAGLLGGVWR